jgi:hypothetical protein
MASITAAAAMARRIVEYIGRPPRFNSLVIAAKPSAECATVERRRTAKIRYGGVAMR